jgi:glycosyltransferase involved in cell wall biosynthesis
MSTKICLNMIVKNEEHLGDRPYRTLAGNYDYMIILDTGSTDRTPEIAEQYMKDNNIPGIVVRSDWKDFDGSRTEALEEAEKFLKNKKGTNYILFWDYDDKLVVGNKDKKLDKPFRINRNELVEDQYMIDIVGGGIVYDRNFMIKYDPNKRFEWLSPVHEFIGLRDEKQTHTKGKIKGAYIDSRREGSRSLKPNKYLNDALAFKKRLEGMKPGDKLYDRYLYYMAQSYRDQGHDYHDLAERHYLERAYSIRKGDEYDYLALLEAAKIRITRLIYMKEFDYLQILKDIGVDDQIKKNCRGLIVDKMTLKILEDAYERRPFRYEAAVRICEHYRCIQKYNISYGIGSHTLELEKHKDFIFVETADHEYKLHEAVAVSGTYCNRLHEAKKLFEHILTRSHLPEDVKKRTENNLDFTIKAIKDKGVKIVKKK